jgi:dihydroorotase
MLGLETALAVVIETMINSGPLSWPDLAKRMSIMPAHIARLADQGRSLSQGEPANVVLVDPSARAVVDRDDSASLSRNNPWHGRDLPDPVVATIWAGRITYQKGQ